VQKINKHIIRVVTLIVALQLLNLSIYAQDFTPVYDNQGNTETNISETVVEFVIEVMLGHTGAIPEQSQHHKDLHFHKHVSYKAISIQKPAILSASQINIAKLPIPIQESFQDLYQQEINPQPPKI
jgi:hypothetical protein